MPRLTKPDDEDDFKHIENERLRFVLYLVRECRCMFEAAAASKWMTVWVCFFLGVPAAWAIKLHFLH